MTSVEHLPIRPTFPLRRVIRLLVAVPLACLGTALVAARLPAQGSTVYRALELEDATKWEEAAALYQTALRGSESVMALIGLERALVMLNRSEELATTLNRLIRDGEDNEVLRPMYVRALLRLERRDAARAFAQGWIGERPLDPEAYRQLYALAPPTAAEARAMWRGIRQSASSDSGQVITAELTEQVFSAGLWGVAREILEERHRRDRSPETAEQLALAAARAGDVERAAVLARVTPLLEQSTARAWLALYGGELGAARRLLARADEADAAAVLPLAVVSRTTAEQAPRFGAGLLRLARGDSVGAARAFARAALEAPGAESLLLAWAARLHAARGDHVAAGELYDAVVREHPESAEAPEAVLGQARALAREHRRAAAVERLEHLILTYPESALVPLARRELDALRDLVPAS